MTVENQEAFDKVAASMPAPGDFEDCYAFSIHKAGSSLMNAMVAGVCKQAGIPGFSIPDGLFMEGVGDSAWRNDPRILGLLAPGRVYYGFRVMPQVLASPELDLRSKRSVLLVRDPRDALVSQYFSFGGKHISHRLPDKNQQAFIDKANSTAHLEIDEYVLRAAKEYLAKLRAYREALDFDRVLLRRYEDIYFDKRRFLGEIFEHFGLPVDPRILEEVAARNDVRPETEQVGKHIRKGAPGDHREKLQSETIRKLDDVFRDVGREYGYEL